MRALIPLLLFSLACGGLYAQAFHVGSEFPVNTYTLNAQGDSAVAIDSNGGFVVVWESFGQDGSGFGVFGRRYAPDGVPQGSEFQINSVTLGNQFSPAIAMDASGQFVVAWEGAGQDGSQYGIVARRFASNGAPLGGEFPINSHTADDQRSAALDMDAAGRFVVVWSSYGQDGDGYGVFARRFSAAGAPLGNEFQVNTTTAYDQFSSGAAVTTDASGNLVVVWEDSRRDGSASGIYAQRFDAADARRGGEFRVNTQTSGRQVDPSVVSDPYGNFVVVWNSWTHPSDGSSWGVFGQRYTAGGAPRAGEFMVNTETYSGQITGGIAAEPSGDFTVVWYSALQDGSNLGIFGQRYTGDGSHLGPEFQINSFTTGEQNLPAIAVNASGDFVVTWYSFEQDGSDVGIFGQRFHCDPEPAAVTDLTVARPNGTSLHFGWTDAAGADDYVVMHDSSPSGSFAAMTGTAADGGSGLMAPIPPGTFRFYLVAGRNPNCGLGPLH